MPPVDVAAWPEGEPQRLTPGEPWSQLDYFADYDTPSQLPRAQRGADRSQSK